MAMTGGPAPFLAARNDLPGALTLTTMTADEARTAGAICAAIDPWLGYPFPEAQLQAFFANTEPDAPRFTLRMKEDFAGALVVRRNWLRGPYVHMLMIAPTHQGRGLGTTLLHWVEAQARSGGDRNLWIAVTSTNVAARRCYERFGFTLSAELDALVRDDKTELLLRKRLT